MKKITLTSLAVTLILTSYQVRAQAQPKLHHVFLKPGKILTDLKTNEEKKITKGIIVLIAESNLSKGDPFLVYNKKGEPTYSTSTDGIIEFQDDVSLLPEDNADAIYPPRSTLKTYNKLAHFDWQFNYHFDIISIHPLSNLYGQSMNTTAAHRFEARSFYLADLPVDFGFAFNYQTGYWKNEAESYSLSILSVGPHFKKTIYEEDEFKLSFHLAGEYAPIYRTSSGSVADHFNAFILSMGAETLWLSKYGNWIIGAQFRQHDLSLNQSTRINVNEEPKEFKISSIGLAIGYNFEWEYK